MKLIKNTPVEKYNGIYVKREDLCFSPPAPPFSKLRGLDSYLRKIKIDGVKTIAYVESAISMAGWGVAYLAKKHGLKAIIFSPVYKHKSNVSQYLEHHQKRWKKANAEIVELPAGRTSVNYHIAKKMIANSKNTVMLPIGLRLPEAIEETQLEVACTNLHGCNVIVVYVGSGTICSGILKGVCNEGVKVVGVVGSDVKIQARRKLILKKAGLPDKGLFGPDFDLYQCNYEYIERPEIKAPFPCHPYYDLKAWEWLLSNRKMLKGPIMFWNIGSDPVLE